MSNENSGCGRMRVDAVLAERIKRLREDADRLELLKGALFPKSTDGGEDPTPLVSGPAEEALWDLVIRR